MKLSPCIILGLSFFSILALPSCGDVFTPDSEVHMLSASDKTWLYNSIENPTCVFQDSSGHQEAFILENEWSGFNSSLSTSGILRLRDREKDQYEAMHQDFLSTNGVAVHISLIANEAPQGTELSLSFKGLRILIDIHYKQLFMIRSEESSRWETFADYKYEAYFDGEIESQLTYLDSLEVRSTTYNSVYKFNLKDFEENWTDSTIVSLSYAKGYGILSYETNGGEVWERIGEGEDDR